MPIDQLTSYQGNVAQPGDFQEFWDKTLAESRALGWAPRLNPVETPLTTINVYDMTFAGYGGEPIKAWVRVPRNAALLAPAVVSYVGYGGGRGLAMENLLWASAGYIHVEMDTRGQGSSWSVGQTPDSQGAGPSTPGVCTRGIEDRSSYYYRRLFTDAVLAVDAARALPQVDRGRVAVTGASQGGAMALAAAALASDLRAAWARVPFLSDIRRGAETADSRPFTEFRDYLATHRDRAREVFEVLAYFDGVNFARLATTPMGMSVGLMDEIVPPATVFAAYNNYAGPKELRVWEFNGHEAGGPFEDAAVLDFFAARV